MAWYKYILGSTNEGRSSLSWHKSADQFRALSIAICLLVFTCFTISATRGGAFGTTELFSGQCTHAININRALQAVLALLAIGINVSFDFFMRLASSPTVDDLREAHSQGRSLDIAVHSLQNVRHISPWRTYGWITLVSLAVPIQLFSHSIAFISFSTTSYSRILVSEAFTTGQPFAYPGVALLDSSLSKMVRSQFHEILPIFESDSSAWDKLEVNECRRIYSQDLEGLQSHRNLLVVMNTGPNADAKGWIAAHAWNVTRFSNYEEGFFSRYDTELENSLWSFATYCGVNRDGSYNNGGSTRCNVSYNNTDGSGIYVPEPWGEDALRDTSSTSWFSRPIDDSDLRVEFQTPHIKYCLSEPYSAPCKVYASNLFLFVTTVCILLGCTCSTVISRFCWHKDTCQSLGDALQAFLKDGETFVQIQGPSLVGGDSESIEPPSTRWTPVYKWKEVRSRWGQAISKRVWLWTYAPIGTLLIGGSAALGALGENISQVPNTSFLKQPNLRLTSLKIRLFLWREPQQ